MVRHEHSVGSTVSELKLCCNLRRHTCQRFPNLVKKKTNKNPEKPNIDVHIQKGQQPLIDKYKEENYMYT